MKTRKKIIFSAALTLCVFFAFWHKDIGFLMSFLSNSSSIGAIKPSSAQLSNYMAEPVPADAIVIELGAGTGPFTEKLIKIVPKENLYIVENHPEFCKTLQKKFPNHTILCIDAQELHKHLPKHVQGKINYVVSGLPFRSLPKDIATNIIASLKKVTNPNLTMIQFTYLPQSPLSRAHTTTLNMKGKLYKTAPLNVPPANVWIYKTKQEKK
jgi:phosphatidylethanolamine/phosphatidyl-N-methylethanolamine N-methyltransferase